MYFGVGWDGSSKQIVHLVIAVVGRTSVITKLNTSENKRFVIHLEIPVLTGYVPYLSLSVS